MTIALEAEATITTTGTIADCYATLKTLDPANKGIYYDLTQKNTLSEIIPTPDIFGLPASPLPENHSQKLVDALYDVVSNAQTSVDILTLGVRVPGGKFKEKLIAALKVLAESKRAVTVRIAFGQPLAGHVTPIDTEAFLKEITTGLGASDRKLKVYVAQYNAQSVTQKSWNHSKIIAADASVAVIGGHNLYDGSYLSATAPVFDLSLKVNGPAAGSAQKFADRVWAFIKTNNKHGDKNWETFSHNFDAATSGYGKLAADAFSLTAAEGKGTLPILAVANPGFNLTSTDAPDASRAALLYFIERAQKTIYVSQQDLMNWPGWKKGLGTPTADAEIMRRLAQFIVKRNGRLMIVISTPLSKADDDEYSHDIDLKTLFKELHDYCTAVLPVTPDLEMARRLKERVFLATIRCNDTDSKWPNGKLFANHAKFWMIDERVFYVGSHNWYPLMNTPVLKGSLQEYGLIIDDAATAQTMLDRYWRPLARYSAAGAVSGTEWGVPIEQTASMPWPVRPVLGPALRIGEAFDDGGRTFLSALTGTGTLVTYSARQTDPAFSAGWRVEAATHANSAFSTNDFFKTAYPAIKNPRSVFGLDNDGDVQQCYAYGDAWHTRKFPRPQKKGRDLAIRLVGPMLYHEGYHEPFRFFAVDELDGIWSCAWHKANNLWSWQEQAPPHRPVKQLGPIVFDRDDATYPLKTFFLDADGNVILRRWSSNSGWSSNSLGGPGHVVTSIGPMLFDPKLTVFKTPLQILAVANEQVFGLELDRASGNFNWQPHPHLGRSVVEIGPAFLVGSRSDYPAKAFVRTREGELWEHFWHPRSGWGWGGHGMPNGKKVAGIGPRAASEHAIVDPVRVFVTSEDGWIFERHWGPKGWQWRRVVGV